MHRFVTVIGRAIAIVLLAVLVSSGCSSGDDTSTSGAPTTSAGATADADIGGGPVVAGDDDLPPPAEEDFVGRARVVNLYLDEDLDTVEIDVWARRSFTAGPLLLAEGIAFGEASDYFATPSGQSIVLVPSGGSSDDEELASMFSPGEDEVITAVLEWDGSGPSAPNFWEADPSGVQEVPDLPIAGEGLVILRAGQLSPWEDELRATVGGRSFYVGGGDDTCLPQQRMAAQGYDPSVLGGTQPTMHDLPAGSATVTLHEWPSSDQCASEAVEEFVVDVVEGETTLVLLYTPDGESLRILQLPIA